MTTDTLTAGLYQRVSTSEQLTDRQHKDNRATAAREGWRAIEYADEGQSASRFAGKRGGPNRADYGRMVADVGSGRLDVVVLWDASRGDRELESWARFLTLCRTRGTLIHVTSEDYTYDVARRPRDWKALASAGVDAAAESDTKSVAVTSGKRSRAKEGVPQGGIAYGIKREWDPSKPKLNWVRDYPDPVTGPVAARIIRRAGLGDGWQEIVDALNADGIPPARAAQWSASVVRRIAANPVYVAAGVVTEAESLAARARVSDAERRGERPTRQKYRYALKCGRCGRQVTGCNGHYRCKQGCATVPAVLADVYIDALCIARLARPDLRSLFERADSSAAAAARAESAAHRQRLTDAAASYADDRIDIGALEAIMAALRPKAEAAEKRARDAETPSALAGLPDEDRAVVAARWDALTLAARKAALRALAPDAVLMPTTKGHPAPVSERVILWPEGVRETATRRQR